MATRSTLAALIATQVLGCVGPEDGTLLEPPDDAGKTDVSSGVERKGSLPFGGAVEGDFTDDFEFHAYTFVAAEGSRVRLEVARSGSTGSLATGVFLYGPRDASGDYGDSIARDYDSGWSKLSKLSHTLAELGSYLVVIGTANGLGRGHYRLGLTCTNGACDHVDEAVWAACDEGVAEGIRECVGDAASELDPGDHPDYASMIDGCTDAENAAMIFEASCGPDAHPAPFCPAGGPAFSERMIPVCREALAREYDIRSPVELHETALSADIVAMVEDAGSTCGEACWAEAAAYVYEWDAPAPPTLREVLVAVQLRQQEPDPADWSNDGTTTAAALEDALDSYGMSGWLDAAGELAEAAPEEIGRLSTSYYVAAGAEAWVSIYVVHFPAVRMVQTVLVGQGET